MSKVKNAIKIILFVVIWVFIFLFVQKILTPRHNNENIKHSMAGLNKLEDYTLDAVFLGSSGTLLSVYPMDIYKQTGVKAYNLSTSGQPLSVSYDALQKIYKNQKPKIVVLNTSGLTSKDGGVYEGFRIYAENIPFSFEKIELAKNCAEYGYTDSIASILFPIIKYHDRWSELKKDDFIKVAEKYDDYYFTMGAYVVDYTKGTALTAEQSDNIINEMIKRNPSEITHRDKNSDEYKITEVKTPIRTIAISDNNKKILKQIKDLCEENNSRLVLTSIPSRLAPMNYPDHAWGQDIEEQIETLAADLGIEYLDFTYNIDVGINMITDTYDQGAHLNTLGARKITNFFCNYFTEQGIVGSGSDPVWDEQLVKWNKLMDVVDWQTDLDFYSYLNKLIANKDKLDIFISASTTYSDALTAEEIEMFKQLGLTLVGDGGFCDSYAAIVSGGDVKYEAVSPRKITYNTTLDDGTKVNLVSSGWFTKPVSSIKINGTEYSPNGECLNFVIRERESGVVIDCVRFATRYPEKKAYHTRQQANVMDYEEEVFNINII